jgi:hypothetical protein
MNRAIARLAAAGARGVIFTSRSPAGVPVAMNARLPYSEEAQPIPALIIGTDGEPVLAAAVRDQTEVAMTIRGTYQHRANARNVVGKLERGDRWMVISTPCPPPRLPRLRPDRRWPQPMGPHHG